MYCYEKIIILLSITLTTMSIVAFGLKPEIQHKFKEPDQRPSAAVTTFFILLVASPAFLLFKLWSKSVSMTFEKINLRRIVFHMVLLAILGCYTRFWLGTNMFDTIHYTAPLLVVLSFVS